MTDGLIEKIASDEIIDQAFDWVCRSRAHYHFNGDVWHLRRWWGERKPQIQEQLRSGNYRFRELKLVRCPDRTVEWWSSQDALVLKAITLVLTPLLQPHLSPRCYHLAGTGGLKGAVREVQSRVADFDFVFRTDVKGYYASINHDILLAQLSVYISSPPVLALLQQYLKRHVSDGGLFTTRQQGISLGCPLSPLMGALFLKPLDDRMAELGCFYTRYMDDWVILAPSRWKLRTAIKAVNEVLDELQVEKHPDKTYIGRAARGFDFLGYWFGPNGLGVALKTVERCLAKAQRLYEQGATEKRIAEYLRNWWRWVKSGVVLFRCLPFSQLDNYPPQRPTPDREHPPWNYPCRPPGPTYVINDVE